MGVTEAELERFYRERFVGLKRALASLTGDYDAAEEALQEAFARALVALPEFRGECPLGAWIWTIASRVVLEQRRTRRRRESLGGRAAGAFESAPQLVVQGHDPRLVEAIRALPPRRRLIVFLRYFGDCSYAEIAAICSISEGTVAASLAQARETLAEVLAREAAAIAKEDNRR